MFLMALEWTRGQKFWMGCGCIPPVQLGAVAVELYLFCPRPPALVWGWFSSPRLKIQLVDPVGVTGGDRA